MNYFIIGYAMTEYLVNGVLLPKKTYTSEEKAKGKQEAVKIDEGALSTLRKNKVFRALEATKKIRVLDKQPAWAVSGVDREAALKARIKELESKKVPDKASALEKALKEAEEKNEVITNEAQKVIEELRAELEALKNKGE